MSVSPNPAFWHGKRVFLKLDISKFLDRLNWEPCWTLYEALIRIVDWHRAWCADSDMRFYCLAEIEDYVSPQAST